ncbi:MAG: hypothetical protein LBV49_08835 [Azonexus sp.]|jgi:hypothetical protein|nr:hypothetical protein [Azonexus sp.]
MAGCGKASRFGRWRQPLAWRWRWPELWHWKAAGCEETFFPGRNIIGGLGGLILLVWLIISLSQKGETEKRKTDSSKTWNLLLLLVAFAISTIISMNNGAIAGGVAALLILSFLLAQWPATSTDMVAPWVLSLCLLIGFGLLDLIQRPLSGAVAGALWFMSSMLIYHHRPHWLASRTLPLRLSATLIAWPATVMLWAQKESPTPAIAACALALISTPARTESVFLFPAWIICTCLLFGLDRAIAAWGQKLRRR